MSVPTGSGNYPAGVTDNDPHFDTHQDDEDYGEEWYCTWCGGDGFQEGDDPLWDGEDIVPCKCCAGTGLRKHQTIF